MTDEEINVGRGRTRPFLKGANVVVSALEWSGKITSAGTLCVMFAALFVNVVLRYAFGSGIPWAYEIHALLLPWLVAGGIVIATAQGRNITISILPGMMGTYKRRYIFVLVNVLILIISLSVLWSSEPILKASQFQRYSTLGFKQSWGYFSLVYAFGAMSVISALDVLRILSGADLNESDPANASLS